MLDRSIFTHHSHPCSSRSADIITCFLEIWLTSGCLEYRHHHPVTPRVTIIQTPFILDSGLILPKIQACLNYLIALYLGYSLLQPYTSTHTCVWRPWHLAPDFDQHVFYDPTWISSENSLLIYEKLQLYSSSCSLPIVYRIILYLFPNDQIFF